jgi:hypothetical protein
MSETRELEGAVQALRKDGTGLLLKHSGGEEWLSYSRPEYREAWYDAQKGDEIRVLLNGSEYQGQTKWFVKSIIPVVIHFVEDGTDGPAKAWGFADKDRLIYLEVLVKEAVNLRIAYSDRPDADYMKAVADVAEAAAQWKALSE